MEGMGKKPWEYGALRVMENGRYFANGERPFFWLGDTAWLMFHKLTHSETRDYLEDRRKKGFTVILADFVHYWPQKNRVGACGFVDQDFTKPDLESGFWQHIDAVFDMAEELGLYLGILPAWGSALVQGGHLKLEQVEGYTRFLVEHFGKRPNLIWITGGDCKPVGEVGEVFDRMGRLLKEGMPQTLVTYHPFGRTDSSQWFQEKEWLDFNLFQSGHRRYDQLSLGAWDDNPITEEYFGEDNWKYVERDLALKPQKPTLDGEPSYEHVLQGLHVLTEPYWQAEDARRYAYWPVFAGAAGHTYGDNSIMQFYRGEAEDGAGSFGVKDTWREALSHPGSGQMQILRRLMEEVDLTTRLPGGDVLILGGQKERYERIAVWRNESVILCYTYEGLPFGLDLREWEGSTVLLSYLNPETGEWSEKTQIPDMPMPLLTTPEREGFHDWVIRLERQETCHAK